MKKNEIRQWKLVDFHCLLYYNICIKRKVVSIMKYVYIVTVQHQDYTWEKISQEGYSTLKLAQQFIENRSDNPQKIDDFRYQSERNIYRIYEIQI